MHDIAVIGAGPAGSQAAARLAAMGHDTIVIDRKRGLWEPVCCTGIVGQECVGAYALGDNIIQGRARSARLLAPSGRSLKVWRPTTQAAILDRAGLNVALATRAQGRGARYMLGTGVCGVSVTSDRAVIEAVRGDEALRVEARAVVIASGYPSGLTEGLGTVGDSAIGAQAEVIAPGIEEVEVYTGAGIAPGFFGWLVPTSPGVALVGLLARRNAAGYLEKLLSRLTVEGKASAVNVSPTYRAMPLKPLPRTYAPRLLVVGAAAGQAKPTTGGGVYYGMLCADIAAQHLHDALAADDLSQKRLSGYQREWKARLGWEIRMGHWARRMYQRLSDSQLERLFQVVESEGIMDSLASADDLSFDWHGGVIKRAIGYQALLKLMLAAGLPAGLSRWLPGQRDDVRSQRSQGRVAG